MRPVVVVGDVMVDVVARMDAPLAAGSDTPALAPGDLPEAVFAARAHLHLAGYVLLRDGAPRAAGIEALRRARAAGMTTSLDPSSVAPLEAVGPARFLALPGHPDLMLPNRDEAAALTGERDPAAAARAHRPRALAAGNALAARALGRT